MAVGKNVIERNIGKDAMFLSFRNDQKKRGREEGEDVFVFFVQTANKCLRHKDGVDHRDAEIHATGPHGANIKCERIVATMH